MSNTSPFDPIIDCPLDLTLADLQHLIDTEPEIFTELRQLILRIFDINEKSLLEASDATKGTIGKLNRKSQAKRLKWYNQRIKDKDFNRNLPDHKVIVAEGDSWFQFPMFIRDIIDWLRIRNPHYAVYSIAYGGDWITNMIYEGSMSRSYPSTNPMSSC